MTDVNTFQKELKKLQKMLFFSGKTMFQIMLINDFLLIFIILITENAINSHYVNVIVFYDLIIQFIQYDTGTTSEPSGFTYNLQAKVMFRASCFKNMFSETCFVTSHFGPPNGVGGGSKIFA